MENNPAFSGTPPLPGGSSAVSPTAPTSGVTPASSVTPASDPGAVTPVSPVTPAAPPEPDLSDEELGKVHPGVQKRINQLTGKSKEASRDAEYWKAVALGQIKPGPGMPGYSPPQAPPIEDQEPQYPDPDKFNSVDEFTKAERQYFVDLAKHEFKKEKAIINQQTEFSAKSQRFQTSILKEAETAPEITTYMSSVTLSPVASSIILESEYGPKLLVHLGRNETDARRIMSLSPLGTARELLKIEAAIAADLTRAAEPPKIVSQAPEPVKPGSTNGSPSTDLEKVSMDQFFKKRNKEQFGR